MILVVKVVMILQLVELTFGMKLIPKIFSTKMLTFFQEKLMMIIMNLKAKKNYTIRNKV